eukprot:GHRQ01002537.1.p2 GENE.GHRQ01002537.1~~GHRQ01002537.1.p2  ORF type:complete len:107 (-),score=15.70 GHRQ01002537.1:815-1135(-)
MHVINPVEHRCQTPITPNAPVTSTFWRPAGDHLALPCATAKQPLQQAIDTMQLTSRYDEHLAQQPAQLTAASTPPGCSVHMGLNGACPHIQLISAAGGAVQVLCHS